MFGVIGLGNTIVDVAALTLLQRSVADEVLGRVFGVLEALVVGSIGIGAVIVPPLIDWLGAEAALIVTGAFLPALLAVTWRRLAAIDAAAVVPERQLALLRGTTIFAPLPGTTLEQLARALRPVALPAGEMVIVEGGEGDRFYVIESGEVSVTAQGKDVATLGPGTYFGEIALLRNVPRTATITTITPVELWSLERDEFVAGVTGHAESASALDAAVGTRLQGLRSALGSL